MFMPDRYDPQYWSESPRLRIFQWPFCRIDSEFRVTLRPCKVASDLLLLLVVVRASLLLFSRHCLAQLRFSAAGRHFDLAGCGGDHFDGLSLDPAVARRCSNLRRSRSAIKNLIRSSLPISLKDNLLLSVG